MFETKPKIPDKWDLQSLVAMTSNKEDWFWECDRWG